MTEEKDTTTTTTTTSLPMKKQSFPDELGPNCKIRKYRNPNPSAHVRCPSVLGGRSFQAAAEYGSSDRVEG